MRSTLKFRDNSTGLLLPFSALAESIRTNIIPGAIVSGSATQGTGSTTPAQVSFSKGATVLAFLMDMSFQTVNGVVGGNVNFQIEGDGMGSLLYEVNIPEDGEDNFYSYTNMLVPLVFFSEGVEIAVGPIDFQFGDKAVSATIQNVNASILLADGTIT